jgi:hypothetical protein
MYRKEEEEKEEESAELGYGVHVITRGKEQHGGCKNGYQEDCTGRGLEGYQEIANTI